MGIFWRKEKIVDLTEYSRRQKDKLDSIRQETSEAKKAETNQPNESSGVFSFFSNIGASNANPSSGTSPNNSSPYDSDDSTEDKKKKLAKRLVGLTTKLEDLSNQIYHLQQRLEVVEKKLSINKF